MIVCIKQIGDMSKGNRVLVLVQYLCPRVLVQLRILYIYIGILSYAYQRIRSTGGNSSHSIYVGGGEGRHRWMDGMIALPYTTRDPLRV